MSVVATWNCEAFVNSLHVYSDGSKVVSADASGKILTWDTRTGGIVDSYSLEDPIHISHIQASPPDAGRQDEEGLLLAANCFDNTLRVFHRRFLNNSRPRRSRHAGGGGGSGGGGSSGSGGGSHKTAGGGAGAGAAANAASSGTSSTSSQSSDAGKAASSSPGVGMGEVGEDREPSLELMHALRGHTVKNWPIRCAFFRGLHHRPPRVRLGVAKGGGGGGGGGGAGRGGNGRGQQGGGGGSGSGAGGGGGKGGRYCGGMGNNDLGNDWQHSLVLATGSTDGSIHVFDLSNGQVIIFIFVLFCFCFYEMAGKYIACIISYDKIFV
ncbi:unnamed protein product [Pylaiella littoralis]